MAGGRRRQVSGSKWSDRLCTQIVKVMLDNDGEPMTGMEIRSGMKTRGQRQIPTPNQLGNLLSKAPYFINMGPTKQHTATTSRAVVALWGFDYEKCLARGWLNEPFENRHVDDPYIEGVTTNRYRPNGVLVGGPKDWITRDKKQPKT